MKHKIIQSLIFASILSSVGLLTGCGITKSNKTVTVQSVATLAGLTDVIQQQHFVGVVSTGKEESVNKDSGRKVKTVNVKEGDIVNAGDILFVYDEQDMQDKLETEKLQLEIDKANLESEKKALENLEKAQAKASADKQLDYALTIREQELGIREKEYNITKKEKEIKSMEDGIGDVNVTAPFAGRITKAGKPDAADTEGEEEQGYTDMPSDDSSDSAFIKIVEIDNYRIKGTINEQNRGDIVEGDIMKIYSRTNEDRTWTGEVSEINYKETQKNTQDTFGETDENTSSSKYTFYVSIDDLDGLIIGQHVYMKVDDGYEPDGKIRLNTSFINDIDTSPWIWAEDSNHKLEKRSVTVSEGEEPDTVIIETGLSDLDYITTPGDYEEGMLCTENTKTTDSGPEAAEEIPDDFGEDFEGDDDFELEENFEGNFDEPVFFDEEGDEFNADEFNDEPVG